MDQDDERGDLRYPTITPYLFYSDVAAAMDWLTDAFGFVQRRRIDNPEGGVSHAEMATGENGVVMFGSPGQEYESPRRRSRVAGSLYVHVDDPDEHAERARRAGAQIVAGPIDQPWGIGSTRHGTSRATSGSSGQGGRKTAGRRRSSCHA